MRFAKFMYLKGLVLYYKINTTICTIKNVDAYCSKKTKFVKTKGIFYEYYNKFTVFASVVRRFG